MSEELKPCPFCGDSAEVDRLLDGYVISCPNPKCGISAVESHSYLAYADAQAAWNTRPGEVAAEERGIREGWEARDAEVFRHDTSESGRMCPRYSCVDEYLLRLKEGA